MASQFVPGDLKELGEQQRMHQRYEAVLEEIDLSGAATRIGVIAEVMGLSVDQLSKRFRRDIGMPLKHYIDQARPSSRICAGSSPPCPNPATARSGARG
jgi:AraC-like DNA-binding protein